MPITDAYATPQQYRDRTHKSNPAEDESLQEDLEAISRYLEYKLHDFWNKDDELVDRIFDPPFTINQNAAWLAPGLTYAESENPWRFLRGESFVDVDSICDITGMEVWVDTNRDQTFITQLATTDYILLPRNALVGPEPKPYQRIVRSTNSVWVPGASIKVKAIWGWPQVPRTITRATIDLLSILRLENPRAFGKANDQIDARVNLSTDAQTIVNQMLKPYKRQPRI